MIKKRKLKNEHLLIPFEEILAETYDTPEKRAKFDKELEEFIVENRRQLLAEMGEKVKKAREKSGVTQEELARRIKTTRSTISRVEKGKQNLTVEYIMKVATALGKKYEIRIY
ncbi:MAG: Helix-turn-helix domain-containing protein [candidate division WS6 bacterium GW2011_GWA2_37_6]|uniref:Helix-turn-helix domain-containing protein n=1 Tax=candidate division WS6 bacterium GW2011_GWA2_37_6 TaxID=1619087 RepID=A0A0G0GZ40_9BACT|nr:MAG: Helix-turn-helix domain-containing protein [candidate division WS6 bacterium GW2011_GWA2_37_6]